MTKQQKPKRAIKGTIGAAMNLRMPEAWLEAISKAAKAHKPRLSAAEWVRQVVGKALGL